MHSSLENYNAAEIKQLLAACKRKYPEHFNSYANFQKVTLWKEDCTDQSATYTTNLGQVIYVFIDSTDNQPIASFDL